MLDSVEEEYLRQEKEKEVEQRQALANPSHVYREVCKEQNCRANSAVLKYLDSNPPLRPLTQLPLFNFYIGPKGFAPVLHLIEQSQTIETIDLRGNGLDNKCVEMLCLVLEKHLGVSQVMIGSNPITVEGGKYLVRLVEANRRIVLLDVSETDIYESIARRITMVVAENQKNSAAALTLIPTKPSSAHGSITTLAENSGRQNSASKVSGAAKAPELTLLQPAAIRNRSADTSRVSALAATSSSPTKRQNSPVNGGELPQLSARDTISTDPNLTGPKPRPPPPALASRDTSRLNDKQRAELLAKYNARAQLYQQVVRSDASRAADRAREELMMIEQQRPNSARVVAPSGRPHSGNNSGNNSERNSPTKQAGSAPSSADAARKVSSASRPDPTTKSRKSEADPLSASALVHRWTISELPPADKPNVDVDASPLLPARRNTMPSENGAAPSTARTSSFFESTDGSPTLPGDSRGSGVGAAVAQFAAPEKAVITLQSLTLTKDEQFKALFNKGCQQYNEKQMDAAYLTWNEAMDLAVSQKNREWMAVVTNNLQRLSYEILVSEGVRHLESHSLEDADKSFQLALEVASKAKNAAWESEMHRARKNVQHAVFQRSHESAMLIFEKAQGVKDYKVTPDDRFMFPGSTKTMQEYTAEFVTEWTRMLFVKEAMEMWADASMVARRIGGTSGKTLLDVVNTSVGSVSLFLAQKYFVSEPQGRILSLQKTSCFSCDEATRLIGLWTDLISRTQTTLSNRVWDALAATELGQLYTATHQLPQALNQFEKVVDLGTASGDKLLVALGHTYLGILHWHRSNFAISEQCFLTAMEHWKSLRVQFAKFLDDPTGEQRPGVPINPFIAAVTQGRQNFDPDDQTVRSSGDLTNVDPSQSTVVLATAVPAEYLNVMLHRCYTYLIRLLFVTSRYKDALEMLERGLLHKYKDRLHDKMLHNFTAKPTVDHISAVASSLDSPIVYYETSYRFEWNLKKEAYDVSQQLLVWVVPKETEMKVVRVDVTADFGVESVDVLVQQVRNQLCVEPISALSSAVPSAGEIITELPQQSWSDPLRKLYEILFYPISDFIHAHDSQSETRGGLVTIIPSGSLWLVPFTALLTRQNKYLIEDYAIQLAFCSMQAAFSALSAKRVRDRNLRQRTIVIHSDNSDAEITNVTRIAPESGAFPFDAVRSTKEGQRISELWVKATQAGGPKGGKHGTHEQPVNAPIQVPTARSEEIVDDINVVRDRLPLSRFLHISVGSTSTIENDDGSSGGLFIPMGQDDLAILRTSEIAKYEIFAELVALTNTNVSVDRVRGTKEGVLSMCRGFLSSGVACVIAAMWCTPDMTPADVFEPFYINVLSRKETHKARALAASIRKLLQDDRYRYSPRLWAGFLVLGVSSI